MKEITTPYANGSIKVTAIGNLSALDFAKVASKIMLVLNGEDAQPEPDNQPAPAPEKSLMTAGDVAKMLGVCTQTVRNYAASGKLKKAGGKKYTRESVIALSKGF